MDLEKVDCLPCQSRHTMMEGGELILNGFERTKSLLEKYKTFNPFIALISLKQTCCFLHLLRGYVNKSPDQFLYQYNLIEKMKAL